MSDETLTERDWHLAASALEAIFSRKSTSGLGTTRSGERTAMPGSPQAAPRAAPVVESKIPQPTLAPTPVVGGFNQFNWD